MKRFFAITTALLILVLFSSCNMSMLDKSSKGTPSVTLYVSSGAAGAKTAIPASFSLDNFDYKLTVAIDGDTEATPSVTAYDYSDLKDGLTLKLEPKKYVFTLSGYIKDTETLTLQGTSTTVDLSKGGGKTVALVMKPVEGLTGKVEISLTYPSSVASVECIVTSDLFGQTPNGSVTVTPDTTPLTSKFTLTDVPSGSKCFAIIHFLDANGAKLASRVESLLVVGGMTSVSTIEITEDGLHTYDVCLKFTKDSDEYDLFGKDVVLIDSEGHEYVLELSNGVFKGTAPEGEYDVYIRNTYTGDATNTGIVFDTADETGEFNFKTVTVPLSGGLCFTPASPLSGGLKGDEDGEYLIAESTAGIEFTVSINDGYEQIEGEDLCVNGRVVTEGQNIHITSDDGVVTTSGTRAIEYHITYVIGEATWETGYTAPASYNADNYNTVTLPGMNDLILADSLLDGWEDEDGDKYANIPSGKTGDLTLTAIWKQDPTAVEKPSVSDDNWTEDEITNDDIKGKIFASGYSLIVKWSDSLPRTTEIYYDYNSDGVIDGDDKLVSNDDFTGYVLEARNEDGTKPASDFTFTILGGNLAGIKGCGKDALNTSTINISGEDTVIGNNTDVGVYLDTLSDERVNINGQLSGNYSITMISANKYEKGHDYYEVARIEDSSYAQMAYLNCLYWETDPECLEKDEPGNLTERYVSQALNIIDYKGEKVVYLANTDPIDLPSSGSGSTGENVPGGIIWVETVDETSGEVISTSLTDFSLGTTATIRVPCSVLSVSVKNGNFYLQQDALKTSTGAKVETDNLGQKSSSEYDTVLCTGEEHPYTYLHMFSTKNQITPAIATEFLRTIIFQKQDAADEIEISVNLETIPYEDIKAFAEARGTTIDKFKYYDGSFYLEMQFPNNGNSVIYTHPSNGTKFDSLDYTEYYSWEKAYDEAKKLIFNGLNGYLMTITSEVENGYVFNQLGSERAWTGGARLKPLDNNYDSLTFTSSGDNDGFYWLCGPEAGQKFYQNSSSDRSNCVDGMYQHFMSGEPNSDSYEPCIQFYKNAEWNNMPHYCDASTEQWGYTPHSYVVEFRPYTNAYTTQKANYQSVSMTSSY